MHVHPDCSPALTQAIRLKSSVSFGLQLRAVLVLSVLSSATVAWMVLSPGSGPHTVLLLLLSTNDEASGTIASLGSAFPDSGL